MSGQNRALTPEDEAEEEKAFERIATALLQYQNNQNVWLHEKQSMYQIPGDQLERIFGTSERKEAICHATNHLRFIRQCISTNQQYLNMIAQPYRDLFPDSQQDSRGSAKEPIAAQANVSYSDRERVKSTLRQIAREWSRFGEKEREQCFRPLLDELAERFPDPTQRGQVRVLNPGAGLGRLTWEIARMGFTSQGNEFSFFMLLTSNAILNKCKTENEFVIFPWIHSFCNLKSTTDQVMACSFPDELPRLPAGSDFSMSAGDFLEVYTEPNSWDCVVTSFFIDTAHNVIDYVECINNILVPGGVWINIGPLLYHWSDMPGEDSLELTFEQIENVIRSFGMVVEKKAEYDCEYTSCHNSMMNLLYHTQFFVVSKPL